METEPGVQRLQCDSTYLGERCDMAHGHHGDHMAGARSWRNSHARPLAPGLYDLERIAKVHEHCMEIMREREEQYGDQWKKYGLRGALYSARRKVERAWAQLWDAPADPRALPHQHTQLDDLYDTINYCTMAILAAEDGNRDGTGGWWPDNNADS